MISFLLAASIAAEAPPSPAVPLAATDLVAARHVALTEAYTWTWGATPRAVTSATLVVVRVDAEKARPRNAWNHVLYAGDTAIEILARNESNTCVVGLVPSTDLDRRPLFWGPMTLPEDVTPAMGAAAAAEAIQAGAQPLGAAARSALEASSTLKLRSLDNHGPELTELLSRCR